MVYSRVSAFLFHNAWWAGKWCIQCLLQPFLSATKGLVTEVSSTSSGRVISAGCFLPSSICRIRELRLHWPSAQCPVRLHQTGWAAVHLECVSAAPKPTDRRDATPPPILSLYAQNWIFSHSFFIEVKYNSDSHRIKIYYTPNLFWTKCHKWNCSKTEPTQTASILESLLILSSSIF